MSGKLKAIAVALDVTQESHECPQILELNESRKIDFELPVSIQKDGDGWFLSIEFDFIDIRCCPFCGGKLL